MMATACSEDGILQEYPDLVRMDIQAALAYAADRTNEVLCR